MGERKPSRLRNLTIVGITALTGLIAVVVITVALIVGLWIDSQIGRRGPATICLLVASVPFSLFLMIRLALGLVKQLPVPTPPATYAVEDSSHEEEE
jgi:hypothetical protein